MSIKEINIAAIIAEGTTQARHYDEKLADRYVEALKDGAVFPPVVAFSGGNGIYLADGFHRRGAALKRKQTTIKVDLREPLKGESPQRSAILYAVGANDEHGQRRSSADKCHAVEMLLRDPEWSKWTDPEIARQCRVSREFVQRHRTKLVNAGSLSKQPKRKAKRGGTVYEIDTANIGEPTPKKKKSLTPEQKKVAHQLRESEKKKPDWTATDEHAYKALKREWSRATEAARAKFRGDICG
jgi:predicted transcriptional regulator